MALCAAITACGSNDLIAYQQSKPTLDLAEYFTGTVNATGVVLSRSGDIKRRFDVVIQGTQQGNQLILDEQFTYYDGETDSRVWTLTNTGVNQQGLQTWEGTAGDVIGTAKGAVSGSVFQWEYVLTIPVKNNVYDISVDDWMYLQNDGKLLNRSTLKKFGVTVGEILLSMEKVDED